MLNNEVGFTLECRPGPGVRIFEVCLLLRGLREASISDSVTSDPVLSFTVTFPIGAGHLLPWSWPTQVHLFRHEVILFFSSWLLPRCSVLLKAPPNFPWCYTHQIPGPADPSCFTSWLSCFQAHFSCLSFGTSCFFKGPLVPFNRKHMFRNQNLDQGCAHCYWGVFVLGSFSRWIWGKKCMYIHTHIYKCLYKHTCPCISVSMCASRYV